MRFLPGYCSLVSCWERLRLKPLELPHASDAYTVDAHCVCMATWERRWVSEVGWKRILGYNPADILATVGDFGIPFSHMSCLRRASS